MNSSRIVQTLWNYCNVPPVYAEHRLTYLLFLKMADEGLTLSASFRNHRFSSLRKCAIMQASEVCHG